uniref:DNA-directed RNA polymerase subunit alpha n=3 Tax=Pyropia TaxID=1094566 RepID=RPOA_PYRYE|nr:RNA polymerase alpha subunit [Neopyropia yezoensis]Q1XDJ5.1 RecName: Full=DNA-directed RNA polymerase subunit alpha; Short=PEP; AltName: Full=Plastid-encoded RNA polymerase subunit alpha; Short=RNA polymerase subunit alpha [Neopyropia yezoensis]ABJ91301.1 DNA-directed RNA polymerase alpha subunit [Neopyropia yezoensis]AGH27619.1 RNA polymerase alpha subunit [Neopyropia yezoensis]QFZ66955.1 RNA polymerase alpha subunit [Neopyropia yezoensis]ULU28934.1 RNA polymerase alpha subunit [Neopyropia
MAQFQIECIESRTDGARGQYGSFVIEPLNQGQGITLGNALRRSILSDLEGTAIVAVRIAGVNHEFSTIPGVREDVLEILLNLKEVVFKSYNKESQIGRIRVQGPAIVTAGLFELSSDIEVVDPRQYIATICNNTIFEMEFKIEKNCGYRLAEKAVDELSVDFLQVDSVFMPVNKVNYKVEEVRIGSNSIKDRLIIQIWTNGSISPQEAISQGATVLTNLFCSLRNLDFKSADNYRSKEDKKISQVLIEELQLSVRAYNCLKRAQIHSIADLLDYSQEELLEIKNFGQKSAEEVIYALQKKLGISLPKEKSD